MESRGGSRSVVGYSEEKLRATQHHENKSPSMWRLKVWANKPYTLLEVGKQIFPQMNNILKGYAGSCFWPGRWLYVAPLQVWSGIVVPRDMKEIWKEAIVKESLKSWSFKYLKIHLMLVQTYHAIGTWCGVWWKEKGQLCCRSSLNYWSSWGFYGPGIIAREVVWLQMFAAHDNKNFNFSVHHSSEAFEHSTGMSWVAGHMSRRLQNDAKCTTTYWRWQQILRKLICIKDWAKRPALLWMQSSLRKSWVFDKDLYGLRSSGACYFKRPLVISTMHWALIHPIADTDLWFQDYARSTMQRNC